jgi:hypothetical protein
MLDTKAKSAQAHFAAVRKLREIGMLSGEVEVEAITFQGTGSKRKRRRFQNKNRILAGSGPTKSGAGQESQSKGLVERERKILPLWVSVIITNTNNQ